MSWWSPAALFGLHWFLLSCFLRGAERNSHVFTSAELCPGFIIACAFISKAKPNYFSPLLGLLWPLPCISHDLAIACLLASDRLESCATMSVQLCQSLETHINKGGSMLQSKSHSRCNLNNGDVTWSSSSLQVAWAAPNLSKIFAPSTSIKGPQCSACKGCNFDACSICE